MTSIKFFTRGGNIFAVECKGHTEYGEEGFDIVCASLSSIVQTAVLGLMQVAKIAVEYEVDEKVGYLKVTLPEVLNDTEVHDSQIIFKTLLLGASDLYEGFSDYINLEVIDNVH